MEHVLKHTTNKSVVAMNFFKLPEWKTNLVVFPIQKNKKRVQKLGTYVSIDRLISQ